MPVSKGISIHLESQFDASTIPEKLLSTPEKGVNNVEDVHDESSPRPKDVSLSGGKDDSPSGDINNPSTIDDLSTIQVSIPNYPSSQFWLSYNVNPSLISQSHDEDTPIRDKHDDAQITPIKQIYFKFLINGTHIVSWGTSERDAWKGKTMFAPFASDAKCYLRGIDLGIEKRGFFFGDGHEKQRIEILCYRARGRRREGRRFEGVPELEEGGVGLVRWDVMEQVQRQRYYQYALADAVDMPYARFIFHVEKGGRDLESRKESEDEQESMADESSSGSNADFSYSFEEDCSDSESEEEVQKVRRLSYPPTIRLLPSSMSSESVSPIKLDREDSSDNETAIASCHDSGSDSERSSDNPRISRANSISPLPLHQKPNAVHFEDTEITTSSSSTNNSNKRDTAVLRSLSTRTPTPLPFTNSKAINIVDLITTRRRNSAIMTPSPFTTNKVEAAEIDTPPSSLRRLGTIGLKNWFKDRRKSGRRLVMERDGKEDPRASSAASANSTGSCGSKLGDKFGATAAASTRSW